MPTYDYQCEVCGHTFDLFQQITARPARKCPSCGKAGLRRLIGTGSGVLFKGSGFYQTDYRSEGYKKAASTETADKGGGEKASSGESSKPSGPSKAAPSLDKGAEAGKKSA